MPVPGRIDAAIQYLRLTDWLRNPTERFGSQQEARDLSRVEQKVEDAALKVLLDYFECKADFGDDPRLFTPEMKAEPK